MGFFTSSAPATGALEIPPGAPLISMRNIEKAYDVGAGKSWVLRRITLDVKPGEFVTIMGPSGAGKSTLLAIMGFLDHQWNGEFDFGGHPVHRMSLKDRTALGRRHVGFVFQQYHLLDDLTVAENLDVPLEYRGVKKSERQALVADALDRFGIVGKKDLFPRQLSGGQQQLVAVARAVIANPKLILADEPTGNLDAVSGAEVMDAFARLNEAGRTIVMVTHNPAVAERARRVLRVEAGRIVADEPVGALRA